MTSGRVLENVLLTKVIAFVNSRINNVWWKQWYESCCSLVENAYRFYLIILYKKVLILLYIFVLKKRVYPINKLNVLPLQNIYVPKYLFIQNSSHFAFQSQRKTVYIFLYFNFIIFLFTFNILKELQIQFITEIV